MLELGNVGESRNTVTPDGGQHAVRVKDCWQPLLHHPSHAALQLIEARELRVREDEPYSGRHPTAFGHLMAAIDLNARGIDEIVIVGDRTDMVTAVQTRYLPNAVLAWGEPYDSPLWEGRRDGHAYVCREFTCQLPVTTVDDLVGQLS